LNQLNHCVERRGCAATGRSDRSVKFGARKSAAPANRPGLKKLAVFVSDKASTDTAPSEIARAKASGTNLASSGMTRSLMTLQISIFSWASQSWVTGDARINLQMVVTGSLPPS
jgi:hypothetical protein